GIELYKANNNNEAKILFEEILEIDQNNGKANYYLGNVEMNLKNYNKAVKHYHISAENNYQILNSKYNVACAASLTNNPEISFDNLLQNLFSGDFKINRIHNDIDLTNFRSSIYYNKFIDIYMFIEPYIISSVGKQGLNKSHPNFKWSKKPQDFKELKEYLISGFFVYNDLTEYDDLDPEEQRLMFTKDGKYESWGLPFGPPDKLDSSGEYLVHNGEFLMVRNPKNSNTCIGDIENCYEEIWYSFPFEDISINNLTYFHYKPNDHEFGIIYIYDNPSLFKTEKLVKILKIL
ncbi:MAG: tetratricopeptide repeat protein, partial [bacterium]